MITDHSLLRPLGVFGFDPVEPVILAALVSEDPLLLIGQGGTGKSFLLNSLSEALGLEHRHYNASLIAFDDLVGFPFPDQRRTGVRYLETPATAWKAESVLIDEINRCKPEHQNRFFALIHERRLQGLRLERLRYRWAAMNPVGLADGSAESYAGCEPLDAALADRFAFVVTVADWAELSDQDQLAVADPRGDGVVSQDTGELRRRVEVGRKRFLELLKRPRSSLLHYCQVAATGLGEVGVRISPRRVRQLTRNILAIEAVSNLYAEQRFLLALRWSVPQRAGAQPPAEEVLLAAHRAAWDTACAVGPDKWLHLFHQDRTLAGKAERLLGSCPDPDTGTLAVTQFLTSEPPARRAAFAMALCPVLLARPGLPVGAEGVHEITRVAVKVLHVQGERAWRDREADWLDPKDHKRLHVRTHPVYAGYEPVIEALAGGRRERAKQLFDYLLLSRIDIEDAAALEAELDACVETVRGHCGKDIYGTRSK